MPILKLTDFTYELPREKIALFPLPERDLAKLLVYRKGEIMHADFLSLPDFLPENAFLFFNDTKVIPARIHFKKDTGADIEIFLLSPVEPSTLMVHAMEVTEHSIWECTIGNLKRWHEGSPLIKDVNNNALEATLLDKAKGLVKFRWSGKIPFAEIISQAGKTPLPPYLKRDANAEDSERYQTIYSHYEGAVAAPTAGLHFTARVFADLEKRKIQHDFLTLHVSAGTFQPVKSENVHAHTMHHEQIIVSRQNLESLLLSERPVVPVGTTSMRTLESIYWFGVKLIKNGKAGFTITQDDPYNLDTTGISKQHAVEAVKKYMDEKGEDIIAGSTSIFIKPGYIFRICHALVTNFHQPESTLIMLVAAFVGKDWKKIYGQALENNYRFLSYGDSSLLIP